MKLIEIQIENFKSIVNCKLKLSKNIHCLVGQNESGKSNILSALTYLNYDLRQLDSTLVNARYDSVDESYPILNSTFKIEDLELSDFQTTLFELLKPTERLALAKTNLINLRIAGPKPEDISITIKSPDGRTTLKFTSNTEMNERLFSFIKLNLPIFQYFQNEEFIIHPLNLDVLFNNPDDPSISSFRKLLELGGIKQLNSIDPGSPTKANTVKRKIIKKINEYLNKYYSQNSDIKISIQLANNILTLHIDEPHHFSSFSDHSTGFQYFFSFLINKIHSEEFKNRKIFYLLDEPALSLHPRGQKDFLKIIEEISKDSQIIYTTHSPFSINRLHPNRVLVINNSPDTGTIVNSKAHSKNWRALRTSLGMDLADSFYYAEKSLVVEGPEDRLYLSLFINYFVSNGKLDLKNDIYSVIDAGGADNLPAMVQLLLDEKQPLVVLMDGDKPRPFKSINEKSKKSEYRKILKVNTVSQFYNEANSLDDFIHPDLYIKGIIQYLTFLLKEEYIKLNSNHTEIPILNPIERPNAYNSAAENICNIFINPDETPLNSKVPISKLGIANSIETAFLVGDLQLFTPEIEAIVLKMFKSIFTDLDLLNDEKPSN